MGNLINLPNISPETIENLKFDAQVVKKNSTFDTKNYLNVRLDENQESRELRIRILPMDLQTGNPFERAYFHTVRVPKEVSASEWKSFLCLDKNDKIDHEKFGHKCPFCELNKMAYEESLKATDSLQKKNYQELSLKNLVKEAVIVRCIERGKEDEGVKFWKFNLSRRKDDPYHVMMDLYNSAKREGEAIGRAINIFDIYNGRDIVITLKKNVTNEKDVRTAMTITTASFETPLSNNEEEMSKWIYDEKKWTDVFTAKPYEYLKLVSQQIVPWFDKEEGKWVDRKVFEDKKNSEKNDADNAIRLAEQASIGAVGVNPAPQYYQGGQAPSNYNPGYQSAPQNNYQGSYPQGGYQYPQNNVGAQPMNDIMSKLNADNEGQAF